jgi:sugar lactone lactonase YvrE
MVGLLVFKPSPINALAWQPPAAPALVGALAPNDALKAAVLIKSSAIHGPEDIAIDAQGRLFTGMHDGRVVQLPSDAAPIEIANTGGRPLGMKFAPDGTLWICDAYKGLLKIPFTDGKPGALQTVLTEVAGKRLNFTDDLDIATLGERRGRIYFTDASSKWAQPDYVLDGLEGRPWGRFFEYDPATGKVRELGSDWYFANGVALDKAEESVFVSETYRYRIKRYWLAGPKAGTSEVWIDNLPGFPDNINSDGAGTIWVAYPSPRKADLDGTANLPWLRNLIAMLPKALLPKPTQQGFVAAYDEKTGQLKQAFYDPQGQHVRMITSATPHQGKLYMGSLEGDRVGVLAIKP